MDNPCVNLRQSVLVPHSEGFSVDLLTSMAQTLAFKVPTKMKKRSKFSHTTFEFKKEKAIPAFILSNPFQLSSHLPQLNRSNTTFQRATVSQIVENLIKKLL